MRIILALFGLFGLLVVTGCSGLHEHQGYGGAYDGDYQGYGHDYYQGYPNYGQERGPSNWQ